MIEGREVPGGAAVSMLSHGSFAEDLPGLDGRVFTFFSSMVSLIDRGCFVSMSLSIPADGVSYEAVAEDFLAVSVAPPPT